MGVIRNLLGLGQTAKKVSEVFLANRTELAQHAHERFVSVQEAYASEAAGQFWFDRFVNALNRLPRPVMALGTVGLFVFSMIDPAGFALRMQGLSFVPDPLWWLLGAVVSFYFGARELHHFRNTRPPKPAKASVPTTPNPALGEWHAQRSESADKLDE